MNEIVAVILTYNRKKMLRRCIDAIQAQKGVGCDIMVVDGHSIDGTQKLFGDNGIYPGVIYYDLGTNMGSAGFCYAIRKAVGLGYRYLWLMDDDVIPDATALACLLRADRYLQGEWGFLVSRAYWKDGTLCKSNIPKTSPLKLVSTPKRRRIVPVKMASWASILIKSDIIYKVGIPIKEYYIGTEDYEYTARISTMMPSYWVTSSKVLHAKEDNVKADIVRERGSRLVRFKYLYRNDMHFYSRYGLQGYFYLILKFVYTFLRVMLFEKKYKARKIRILVKSYISGIKFNPKPERL